MITVSRLFPVAVLGALSLASAARAVTFDFSTSNQYTDNFAQVFVTSGSNNALGYNATAQAVQHTATASGAAVFAYDTIAETPTNLISNTFTSVNISFDFSSQTTNTSFGVFFGSTRTNANLALFNLNNGVGVNDDTIRFFTAGNPTNSNAGTLAQTAATLTNGVFTNGNLYHFSLTINYVTSTSANVTLSITDPNNALTPAFSSTINGMSVSASSEISIRSSFNGGGGTNTIDNVVITPTAVPEPSTYAAIAGAGVLGLAVYLRRKRIR